MYWQGITYWLIFIFDFFCIHRIATTKILVKFRFYSKVIVTNDFVNLCDIIKTKYRAADSFPAKFSLKFEDKEFCFIDLDSPVQWTDTKSNILMVSEP